MCDKSVVILKKLETALGKINSSRSSSSLLGLPLSSLQPRSFFGPRPSLRLPLWPKRCACTVGRAATIDQLDKYINFLQVKKKRFQTDYMRHATIIAQLVKVSKFRKQILKFSFAPKNERKYFCISALASKKRSNQKDKGTLYCQLKDFILTLLH